MIVLVDAYAEAAGAAGDDVVDRSLALLPALRLVLLLQRARRLSDPRTLLTQAQREQEAALTSSSLALLLRAPLALVLA